MERNPNRREKRVSAIPTQAMMPRTNRTGLMPKLGEAGPEERTICMPDFDYGAVKQARQAIPSRRASLERGNNRESERLREHLQNFARVRSAAANHIERRYNWHIRCCKKPKFAKNEKFIIIKSKRIY